MKLSRNLVSDYQKSNEKPNYTQKFVVFLIKVGIIPISLNKEGEFIFKLLSWKILVYLFLSFGHLFLYFLFWPLIYNVELSSVFNFKFKKSAFDQIALYIFNVFSCIHISLPLLLCHGIAKLKNGEIDLKMIKLAKGKYSIYVGRCCQIILTL